MITRSNILLLFLSFLICLSCSSQEKSDEKLNSESQNELNQGQIEYVERILAAVDESGMVRTSQFVNNNNSQNGVWISGRGQVSGKPDISFVSLGVEVKRKTLSKARSDSAESMSAIIENLLGYGIIEDDIRTTNLSMAPQYVWKKVNGDQERVIDGYVVNNTLSVTVRDLSRIGKIVDGSLAAGGEVTRINSIQFSIENVEVLETKAREMAIKDAINKAKQFETSTDMNLGPIIYLTETGSEPIISAPSFKSAQTMSAMEFDTPVIAGSLDVEISIRIGFAIK